MDKICPTYWTQSTSNPETQDQPLCSHAWLHVHGHIIKAVRTFLVSVTRSSHIKGDGLLGLWHQLSFAGCLRNSGRRSSMGLHVCESPKEVSSTSPWSHDCLNRSPLILLLSSSLGESLLLLFVCFCIFFLVIGSNDILNCENE